MEEAASALARAGAEVREIDPGPSFHGLVDSQIAIMGAEGAQSLRSERMQREADLSGPMREFLDQGKSVSPERLREAREQAERCRQELGTLFAGLDAVLTPAAVGEAPVGLGSTGDRKGAARDLHALLELDPEHLESLRRLGEVYAADGHPVPAVHFLERFLAGAEQVPVLRHAVHLKVADLNLQKTSELGVYAGPSNRYCPAGVYASAGQYAQ